MTDAPGKFVDPKHISEFMDKMHKLGGLVEVTEMQLGLTRGAGDDDYRLQAWVFGGIWDACLRHTNCLSVVVRFPHPIPEHETDLFCSLRLPTMAGRSGARHSKPRIRRCSPNHSVRR